MSKPQLKAALFRPLNHKQSMTVAVRSYYQMSWSWSTQNTVGILDILGKQLQHYSVNTSPHSQKSLETPTRTNRALCCSFQRLPRPKTVRDCDINEWPKLRALRAAQNKHTAVTRHNSNQSSLQGIANLNELNRTVSFPVMGTETKKCRFSESRKTIPIIQWPSHN